LFDNLPKFPDRIKLLDETRGGAEGHHHLTVALVYLTDRVSFDPFSRDLRTLTRTRDLNLTI